jgi:acylphosphatase
VSASGPPEPEVRRRIVVRGLVQGVSFRAHTQAQARRLRLVGWVRNRADGSVELEMQGPAEQVAQLLSWCRRGPPQARVDELESHELCRRDREDPRDGPTVGDGKRETDFELRR